MRVAAGAVVGAAGLALVLGAEGQACWWSPGGL